MASTHQKTELGRVTTVRRAVKPAAVTLAELGLDDLETSLLQQIVALPRGLVLVVGPDDSGRSMTVAALAAATEDRTVACTPATVFHTIDGATRATRAIALAADRLVIADVVAQRGTEALARLAEDGVDPAALSRVLVGVVFQRLVRRVCASCVDRYDPSASDLGLFGIESLAPGRTFAQGLGCESCHGTGRAGRVPVVELLVRPPTGGPRRRSLTQSVIARLLAGIVSTEEALAVIDLLA